MDDFVLQLVTWPRWLVCAGAGALGGLIGGLLVLRFPNPKVRALVPALCAVLPGVALSSWLQAVEREQGGVLAVRELESKPIFAALFRYHPESRQAFVDAFQPIVAAGASPAQAQAAAAQVSARIVAPYFARDVLRASPAAVYGVIKYNASAMHALQNNPPVCVATFQGNVPDPSAIPMEMAEAWTNLGAAVIESAGRDPSPPPAAGSPQDLFPVLAGAYRAKGLDPAGLLKLGAVPSLPPAEGCRIGTDFFDALASLGEEQSAQVYKRLVALSGGT